ncbi:MAG: hypothetical protein AAGA54_33850 [Myxococcota bacterium]
MLCLGGCEAEDDGGEGIGDSDGVAEGSDTEAEPSAADFGPDCRDVPIDPLVNVVAWQTDIDVRVMSTRTPISCGTQHGPGSDQLCLSQGADACPTWPIRSLELPSTLGVGVHDLADLQATGRREGLECWECSYSPDICAGSSSLGLPGIQQDGVLVIEAQTQTSIRGCVRDLVGECQEAFSFAVDFCG